MMPRSQTFALVVLFATLALLLAAAGAVGVSTKAFGPQSTPTASPTVTSTPTPTQEPASQAEHWTEGDAGVLTYTADATLQAQASYETSTLDDFVTQVGIEAVPADTKYPLANALEQFKTVLEGQIAEGGYTVAPDAFTGPDIKIIGDEAVNLLRVQIPPQTTASGTEFPGVDLAQFLVDKGDGNMLWMQFVLRGALNSAPYDDFLVWMDVHLPDLMKAPDTTATPAAETPVAETPVAETPAAEGTPAAETPVAETTTEAPVTPVAEAQATPQATATRSAVETVFSDKWTEGQAGSLTYVSDPNITIQYGNVDLASFAQRLGVTASVEGQPASIDDVLTQTRAGYDQMIQTNSITIAEGDLVGPAVDDLDGVTVNYLYISLSAQTTASGQQLGGSQQYLGLIDLGDGQVQLIVFTNKTSPDPAVYADFRTWLTDNATVLAQPVPTPEPTPAP